MSILTEAQAMKNTLVEYRRCIHQHAETESNLPVTRAFVMEKLTEMGYEPKEIGGGITAIAGGKKPGKTFLIRGDMDALPIAEENDLEYKSQTGNMHACGHDIHTASMLGAAKLLKLHEDEIEGSVKLMFQPAEEVMEGAREMINAGILENPKVDAAMMIHVAPAVPMPAGTTVFVGTGSYAASDWFKITVQGKGAHGAAAFEGVDPINVLAHIHTALQAINAREVAAKEILSLTVGEIHSGSTSNVLPDTGYMSGTIRTLNEDVREFVRNRLKKISEGIAKTFRAEAKVEFPRGCPSMKVDDELEEKISGYTKEMLTDKMVIVETAGSGGMGSEDFALVAERVPSICVALAAGSPADGYTHPLHHPMIKFDENALPYGAAIYANAAIRFLKGK